MSDQNVPKDWKAYFASLGPKQPSTIPDKSEMYSGTPNPHVMFVKGINLEGVPIDDGESLFERAKEVYEANGKPEMWIFSHMSGPPWHCSRT